eukprot:SAG11_NODE_7165_length_1184_cov_3.982488_1_plen_134_part_00
MTIFSILDNFFSLHMIRFGQFPIRVGKSVHAGLVYQMQILAWNRTGKFTQDPQWLGTRVQIPKLKQETTTSQAKPIANRTSYFKPNRSLIDSTLCDTLGSGCHKAFVQQRLGAGGDVELGWALAVLLEMVGGA